MRVRKKRVSEYSRYDSKYLTIDEAVHVMKVSRRTLYRLMKSKKLKVVHLTPRICRIRFTDLKKLLHKRGNTGKTP